MSTLIENIPTVLAGPMVRRATSKRIYFWIATSIQLIDPEVRLYLNADEIQGINSITEKREYQLGKRFFIYLLRVDGDFPTDEIIGYDIVQITQSPAGFGTPLREIMDISSITTPQYPFPTFYLPSANSERLHALYCSCRKLHGPGLDMTAAAYNVIKENIHDTKKRPSVIFMGGDQIYADDVSEYLLPRLTLMGIALIGDEVIPLSDFYTYKKERHISKFDFIINNRKELLKEDAKFTSGEMDNHLITFGEYVSMYLHAWNNEMWKIPLQNGELPNKLNASLNDARNSALSCRFVLANSISYMVFDDHDITDDWFLDENWKEKALSKPLGRRIIANGLLAYWAFQGFGNNPEDFLGSFKFVSFIKLGIHSFLKNRNPKFEDFFLYWKVWSYLTPTSPPALVLNTRTQRTSPKGVQAIINDFGDTNVKHKLFDEEEKLRLKKLLLTAVGRRRNKPIILVSPTPIFGIGLIELLQHSIGGTFTDAESYAVNPSSIMDLIEVLSPYLPKPLVILSGDVHFGFEINAFFNVGNVGIPLLQLCSSAIKNHALGFKKESLVAVNGFSKDAGLDLEHSPYGYFIGFDKIIISKYPRFVNNPFLKKVFTFVYDFESRSTFISNNSEPREEVLEWPLMIYNNLGEIIIDKNEVKHRLHYNKGQKFESLPFHSWNPSHWKIKESFSLFPSKDQ